MERCCFVFVFWNFIYFEHRYLKRKSIFRSIQAVQKQMIHLQAMDRSIKNLHFPYRVLWNRIKTEALHANVSHMQIQGNFFLNL